MKVGEQRASYLKIEEKVIENGNSGQKLGNNVNEVYLTSITSVLFNLKVSDNSWVIWLTNGLMMWIEHKD